MKSPRLPFATGKGGHLRNHFPIPPAKGALARTGRVWRWRIEIGGAALIATCIVTLPALLGGDTALLVLAVGTLLGVAMRRRLPGWVWARLVRHRFQGLCLRTALRTVNGRLPLVVHARWDDDAVVLLVWCRSGMSLPLFDSYREEIKSACFARDVRIGAHHRWSHLLVMEILF